MKKTIPLFLVIIIVIVCFVILEGVVWFFSQISFLPGPVLPLPGTGIQEWALEKAIGEKNPDLCDKINKGYIFQDIKISAEEARANCKVSYAITTDDIDYCLSLPAERQEYGWSLRDGCFQGLAIKLQRPDLCELMPSAKDEEYGDFWLENCKQAAQSATMEDENEEECPACG